MNAVASLPAPWSRATARLALMGLVGLVGLLAACASSQPASPAGADPAKAAATPGSTAASQAAAPAGTPRPREGVLAGNERIAIYQARAGDTLASIAQALMGDATQAWQITEANGGLTRVEPGQALLVPLRPLNPTGVQGDRVQTVPILCYHRFGPGSSRMILSAESFEAQLAYLADNGYSVIPLARLVDFLQGKAALPAKAVVITIDDGYESVHRHAFPLLRKYGFTATLFVYTDFVGYGDALSWAQLREMSESGVIDLQAHSKSHRNLLDRIAGESDERYLQVIEQEVEVPRNLLEKRVPGAKVRHYAFPFGDANERVLDALQRHGYGLGVTVNPGGNAFYAQPLMLRRTMIFGDVDLDGFKAKLQISRPVEADK
jgi:peptidoglycan/xylan/chitin deacetylase (PgdA/CDA1 family)